MKKLFIVVLFLTACGKSETPSKSITIAGVWKHVETVCGSTATTTPGLVSKTLTLNDSNEYMLTQTFTDCISYTSGKTEVNGSQMKMYFLNNSFEGACPGYSFTPTVKDFLYQLSEKTLSLVGTNCTDKFVR